MKTDKINLVGLLKLKIVSSLKICHHLLFLTAFVTVTACDSDNLVAVPESDPTIVGFTAVPLNANKKIVRGEEAVIGNLVADAFVFHALNLGYQVDFAITNGGSIRFSTHANGIYPVGNISRNDINEMLPFGNTGVIVNMSGAELKSTLERGYHSLPIPEDDTGSGSFLQVSSALALLIELANQAQILDEINEPASIAIEGQRLISIKIAGQEIVLDDFYDVLVPDYIASGGDGFVILGGIPASRKTDLNVDLALALEDYLMLYSPVTPTIEGRITFQSSVNH